MTVQILQGDAVKWAQEYKGDPFHALLCDPPYHLTSIVKRYGKPDAKTEKSLKKYGTQGVSPYMRGARGFMGKKWDGGDVAFDPGTWAAFSSVMYPGAFGMAFASSRGWHRLAVAIEDGGFIIHPSIFGWLYGSGFPKATRVKAEGFDGYRYGLQALKPALEPIIVFQKPYEGRPVDNITETGAGALNIDGGRIPLNGESYNINRFDDGAKPFGGGAGHKYSSVKVGRPLRTKNKKQDGEYPSKGVYEDGINIPGMATGETTEGRWAANFILLDDGAAEALDKQSGHLVSGQPAGVRKAENHIYGQYVPGQPVTGFGDEGGASRFFFRVSEQIDSADPVYYEAKASTEERDAGLQTFDAKPSYMVENGSKGYENSDGANRGARNTMLRNPHPTVKPLALARYLATLLLPPTQYAPRRLFVPFAGVASEMIGAYQAGWEDITGVELTEEYIPIAEARVKYWKSLGYQTALPMFAEARP